TIVSGISADLDAVVMHALERDPVARFQNARAMAAALEGALRPATAREVSEWLDSVAHDGIAQRAALVRAIESGSVNGNAAADAPTAPGIYHVPARVDTGVANVTETPIAGTARGPMRSLAPRGLPPRT